MLNKDMNKDSLCLTGRLCPVSLGIALGITEGIFMLLFAWAGWLYQYATAFQSEIAGLYYGYGATLIGGLWGFLWGFIDGFVFGIIAALIYNCCFKCCKGCCRKSGDVRNI